MSGSQNNKENQLLNAIKINYFPEIRTAFKLVNAGLLRYD